ncbi:hypothetical protein B0J12DRAFT_241554 [Macrophomina phaseolina]|uniref:Uncharacterized protein n=1 Tax=Macrophomina phaseolina TaxID=35725 RepID=A0ABQ8GRF3_9PEZI|nr:hypothetical protein B0J12DRAFT_241554 [Macrophomina phaseolina]
MAMDSERFGLLDYINEQVLAQWTDTESCETRVLGSLSTINKQDAGLSFRVGLDSAHEQAFIRLSMHISVRVSGRPRKRQLLLVLPLHTLSQKESAFQYEHIKTPNLGALAPAIHDAGLTDSGFVIRAQVNLREAGYVLMPKSNAKALRPSTSTAASNLAAVKSLSQVLFFTLYIKPSDYARQGLNLVEQLLGHDTLKQYPLQWDAMYGEHGAQLVDWDMCDLGRKEKEPGSVEEDVEPPPPYLSEPQVKYPRTPSPPPFEFPPSPAFLPPLLLSPTQYTPSPEIHVARSTSHFSPSEILSAAGSLFDSDDCTIPATPDCLPEYRALRDAHAVAQQETQRQNQAAPGPQETGRKRGASFSPNTSPATANAQSQAIPRLRVPKRICKINSPHTVHNQPEAATAATAAAAAAPARTLLPPLLHAPAPSYAALQNRLFPYPHTTAPHPPRPNTLPTLRQQQPTAAPARLIPNTPAHTLTTFLSYALAHNPTVYAHSRLRALLLQLGSAARANDVHAFSALRAKAEAAFFFDPADSFRGAEELERGYVEDMERMLEWVFGVDGGADRVVWEELVALGKCARDLVERGVGAREGAEEWRWETAAVVGRVCVGFGG